MGMVPRQSESGRRYQFTLKTLLVVMTVAGVVAGVYRLLELRHFLLLCWLVLGIILLCLGTSSGNSRSAQVCIHCARLVLIVTLIYFIVGLMMPAIRT